MNAVEQLTAAYRAREVRGTVGVTSQAVPWEILESAGLNPVLLNPPPGASPLADRYMEEVFEPRYRLILDGILAARWPSLDFLVIPRTSEPEHKLFLYLRELQRQGLAPARPKVILYNLLQSDSPEARAYGLGRTRDLMRTLGGTNDRLPHAVERGNRARAAALRILNSRRERKLLGGEAFPLLGARYFLPTDTYAILACAAAEELQKRAPHARPSILIKGSPLDSAWLHEAIERHGAIVTAEDDPSGSRMPMDRIPAEGDLVGNVFEAIRFSIGPRHHPDGWFESVAPTVDGVVFYLSPDDDVLGWAYPRWSSYLEARLIPHQLVRGPDSDDALGAFLSALGRT